MIGLVEMTAVEQRLQDITDDLWIFLEPPDRILVPLFPERDIDPEAVAVPQDLLAQLGADAEEHLKLHLLFRNAEVPDQAVPRLHQRGVVRRDTDPGVISEHEPQHLY